MRSSEKLRIASLNVRGLNERNKRLATFQYFEKSNFALILLQETKTKSVDENQIRREWHNHNVIINSTPSLSSSGGSMILINSHKVSILDRILTPDGRCIAIDIDFCGSRFHVVNAYFPIENQEKRPFITSLYPIISSQYPIIFGGDFNLALDPKVDRYPPRTVKDTCCGDFKQLITTFDLKDVCRELFPCKKLFSFHRGTSRSRIDHIFVSKSLIFENYVHNDFSFSDHDIISCDLSLEDFSFVKGKGYWRNSTKIYESDDFVDKFKIFWAKNVMQNNKRYTGSWWVETKFQIKKFLITLTKQNFEEKNDEIIGLKMSLERKKFLASLNPNSKIVSKNYEDCKKRLAKKQIDLVKEKVFHDKIVDLSFGDVPTKAFFEKLSIKKSNPEPRELYFFDGFVEKNPTKVVHVAKEFFEEKFRPMKKNENANGLSDKYLESLSCLEDGDVDREFLMKPVTLDELHKAIMSFKNGKAPGIDGLSIEFYKKSFGIIKHHFLNFVNDCIFGDHIPRKVNTGVIKLLYKKEMLKILEIIGP